MKSLTQLAFVLLVATALSAQTQTNCVREGEWTKCDTASTAAVPDAPPSPAKASSSLSVAPAPKFTGTPAAQSWLQPVPQTHRTADAKFWLAVATPQILNAAYRVKFGSCYPTRCVEGSGLPPNQHFALFAGLNGLMGAVAYKAKKDHSRFWAPVALMLTPLSVYDLQHRPN